MKRSSRKMKENLKGISDEREDEKKIIRKWKSVQACRGQKWRKWRMRKVKVKVGKRENSRMERNREIQINDTGTKEGQNQEKRSDAGNPREK